MVAPHKNRLEKQQLLTIISKYESIIDSRKADRKTIVAKRKAWIHISAEFNRLPNVRPCNPNQLKRFWSNLKARDMQIKKEQDSRSVEGSSVQQFYVDDEDEHLDEVESSDNEATSESPRTRANVQRQEALDNDANRSLDVNSVVNVQLSKLELSMAHMRELHQLAVQREKLQLRLLEQQLEEQTISHQFRLDNEREIHQLRLKHQQELHLQRMRYEQEQIVLQQGKIHEVHGYTIR